MAIKRMRKNKENPHYNFLVSWQPKDPSQAHVKRESNSNEKSTPPTLKHGKKAESLAQDALASNTKKNIIRSLIIISLIVILELVIYLAWNKFITK